MDLELFSQFGRLIGCFFICIARRFVFLIVISLSNLTGAACKTEGLEVRLPPGSSAGSGE